jgi:hypothetical protein
MLLPKSSVSSIKERQGALPFAVCLYYSSMMQTFLSIILAISLLSVVIVLLVGVGVFVKGGETNRRWSVKLMSLRVATQAVALVTLGLLLLMR